MKNKLPVVALLISTALTSCSDQPNYAAKSKPDTTKELQEKVHEETSIKGILANTVTLLRNHNVDVNNDRCFAEMILYSNHAAIDISDVLFRESKNEELKKFAKENVGKRSDEMNEMSQFLQNEPDDKSSTSKDFQNAVNSAISKMGMGINIGGNNVDIIFIKSMIPLQQCAIDIAEAEIRHGSHQTLKIHARNIVSSGDEDINWMQDWVKKNRF